MSVDFLARLAGMVVFGFLGWQLGFAIALTDATPDYIRWVLSLSLSGAALGLLLTPSFTTHPIRWLRKVIREMAATDLIAGTIGTVVGLLISALLAIPISMLPGPLANYLPLIIAAMLAYFGAAVLVMRQQEIFSIIGLGSAFSLAGRDEGHGRSLLDTSAIVDGRIVDVSQAGLLQGVIVIPQFVLAELHRIADSPEPLKRSRGRRGLEMLRKLQKESAVPIIISDVDFEDSHEVDAKLVKLARKLHASIVTTDYNLNRVAEIQGVRVLNLNDLTNAVRAVVLPGDVMIVRIVQEGKEANQGLGYLDDGTMVVVEGGRRYIENDVNVVITRVLQTAGGRIIFAQPRTEQLVASGQSESGLPSDG